MRRYLFLLAWMDGSDSVCGEKTYVKRQDDLLPQFRQGNEHVFALGVIVPDSIPTNIADRIAENAGYGAAFHDDYTSHDSLSVLYTLEEAEYNDFPSDLVIKDYSF